MKKPSDDLDRIKRDDNMKKSIKQRKVSADGIFFTQQMNIIPQSSNIYIYNIKFLFKYNYR